MSPLKKYLLSFLILLLSGLAGVALQPVARQMGERIYQFQLQQKAFAFAGCLEKNNRDFLVLEAGISSFSPHILSIALYDRPDVDGTNNEMWNAISTCRPKGITVIDVMVVDFLPVEIVGGYQPVGKILFAMHLTAPFLDGMAASDDPDSYLVGEFLEGRLLVLCFICIAPPEMWPTYAFTEQYEYHLQEALVDYQQEN